MNDPLTMLEVPARLLTGWWTFLRHNLTRFTPDPDLWVPSVIALLVCIGVFYFFARQRRLPHPLSAAVSLTLLLPILFATAFLVPGIILQLRLLLGGL